jgi:CcmD family protein
MLEYGKIFVVVAVLSVILIGIFGYLFVMDRKIGKLEKEIKDGSTQKEK